VSYDGTVVGTIAKTVTPTFTDAVDVIVDGTKLTTTGTAGWNSGIFSLESFSANGSVSATAESNREAVMLGLSYTNEDANYDKINYAIFLTQTSNIDIYEIAGGATINTRVAFRITSYNANDTFSIERNDNTITYLKNGTVFYTSLNTSTGNLHLDTSFNTTNSELLNVQIKGSDNNAGNLEITFISSIVATGAVDASGVDAKVSGVFAVRLLAVVLLKPCSSVTLRVTVCAEPV
jgi:hypothetical protein